MREEVQWSLQMRRKSCMDNWRKNKVRTDGIWVRKVGLISPEDFESMHGFCRFYTHSQRLRCGGGKGGQFD